MPFLKSVFKAVPAIIYAAGGGKAEGGSGQRTDESDLRFLGVIRVVFEWTQRVLVRILRIFVHRVPYRDLSDSGGNEAVKLPAVAGRPDVLVGTDHHHRNGDPLQQLRQLPADPGGIEQHATPCGGVFPQRGGDCGCAE